MAGRQGAAGHRGSRAPLSGLAVVVHDTWQARAVLQVGHEHGLPVVLVSAPGAAAGAGVGFFRAMEELLGVRLVVDCDDDAGLVMAGLRAGLKQLLFGGPDGPRRRLEEIAEAHGASLAPGLAHPLLLLEPGENPARRLGLHLARGCAAPTPAAFRARRRPCMRRAVPGQVATRKGPSRCN